MSHEKIHKLGRTFYRACDCVDCKAFFSNPECRDELTTDDLLYVVEPQDHRPVQGRQGTKNNRYEFEEKSTRSKSCDLRVNKGSWQLRRAHLNKKAKREKIRFAFLIGAIGIVPICLLAGNGPIGTAILAVHTTCALMYFYMEYKINKSNK